MATETCTQAYGEPSYWDNRYSNESGPFDWYQKYHSLAPLVNLYVSRHHRTLAVGCGNSAFSEGMVDDGYEDVVNVDISSVVIEAMQKKYCNLPQLKYVKMDVRDMSTFETCSFHAVLDKDKFVSEKRTDPPKWDLLKPVPFDNDVRTLETMLGQNPDIHYVYICTKDSSLKTDEKHEVAVE